MSWFLAVAIGSVLAAGIYLALSRALLRIMVGISLIGAGANLMLFVSGRLGGSPPVIESGAEALVGGTNPLPQALVLTAIVIGFALTCLSLIIALAVRQTSGENNADRVRHAEPEAHDEGGPAVIEPVVKAERSE